MRNQWFIWALVAAVGIFVLMIFNYQGQHDSVPLSDIFPDQDKGTKSDIEYEFVDEIAPISPAPQAQITAQPSQPGAPVQPQPQFATPSRPASPSARLETAAPVQQTTQTKPVDVAKARNVFSPSTASPQPQVEIKEKVDTVKIDRAKGAFTIQVASYQDRKTAEVALKGIQAAGQPAYLVAKELGAKGTRYRIYVGSYQTKEEANQKLSELKSSYSNSFIISP